MGHSSGFAASLGLELTHHRGLDGVPKGQGTKLQEQRCAGEERSPGPRSLFFQFCPLLDTRAFGPGDLLCPARRLALLLSV